MAIEDRHVGTRRPIRHVPNMITVCSCSSFRKLSRQMAIFFSPEQVAHRQRYWQQGNKILSGFAVRQTRGKYCIFDFESYLHSVCLFWGCFSGRLRRGTAGRTIVGAASAVMKGQYQCENQTIASHCGLFSLAAPSAHSSWRVGRNRISFTSTSSGWPGSLKGIALVHSPWPPALRSLR
jgi:hypothetical protein